MCAPLGSVFSFHLDFEVSGFQSVKLSFSNIYKAVKVDHLDQIMSERGIQLPLTELEGKWSVVCIDVKSYLAQLVLSGQQKPPTKDSGPAGGTQKTKLSLSNLNDLKFDFTLSSLELCAKALYRGVFISDVAYSPKNLPKEMTLLLGKHEKFEDKYVFKHLVNDMFVYPAHRLPQVNDDSDPNNIRGRSTFCLGRTRPCRRNRETKTN
jgi:hypothetical protein